MDKFSLRRMPLLLALAMLALAALVLTGGASASRPTFYSSPTITYKDGSPVTAPKVGDVVQGNNGGIYCDPSCDPLDPTAQFPNGPNQVLLSGDDPPVGTFFQFRRCNDSGCFVAQAKSTNRYYTITSADAGYGIRLTVILTNIDCTYPRSYDQYQECR